MPWKRGSQATYPPLIGQRVTIQRSCKRRSYLVSTMADAAAAAAAAAAVGRRRRWRGGRIWARRRRKIPKSWKLGHGCVIMIGVLGEEAGFGLNDKICWVNCTACPPTFTTFHFNPQMHLTFLTILYKLDDELFNFLMKII